MFPLLRCFYAPLVDLCRFSLDPCKQIVQNRRVVADNDSEEHCNKETKPGLKTIFVSELYDVAVYWTERWGFDRQEVTVITNSTTRRLAGMDISGPVFVCGNGSLSIEVLNSLEAAGATVFIDAHALVLSHIAKSALDALIQEAL